MKQRRTVEKMRFAFGAKDHGMYTERERRMKNDLQRVVFECSLRSQTSKQINRLIGSEPQHN